MEQILVGISGNTEFGEKCDSRMVAGSTAGKVQCAFNVIGAIRHADRWDGDRRPYVAVGVNRIEMTILLNHHMTQALDSCSTEYIFGKTQHLKG